VRKFRFLEFAFIVLFILIEQIFLIKNVNSFFGYWLWSSFYIYPFYVCAFIPIKIYPNAEADKSKILKENTNKSGIYMWKNNNNGKQYIGSAVDLYYRLSFYFSCKAIKN